MRVQAMSVGLARDVVKGDHMDADAVLAEHDPVVCILRVARCTRKHYAGVPCTTLRRGVTARNIVAVIAHEALHHVLTLVVDVDEGADYEGPPGQASGGLDNLMPTLALTKEWLGCRSGLVGDV